MATRSKVFISYSHKDRPWLERLQVHLKPLERDGLLERWDDTRLRAGDRWRDEIGRAIASARAVVLLISADFLASDFIEKEELPPLLAAAEREGAAILPVIVGFCLLDGPNSTLARFQAVNSPAEPLEVLNEAERNRVWVKLARDLWALLKPDAEGPDTEAEQAGSVAPAPAEPIEPPRPAPAAAPLPPTTSTPAATAPAPPVAGPGQGRHALLVINDRHVDPVYAGLVAPMDDTLGLEAVLASEDVGGFKVTTLRNQSRQEVEEAVAAFFAERKPEDIALLYYYGLAIKDAEFGLYFATQDSRREDPSTATPVYKLQGAMRNSLARLQMVLVDCTFVANYTQDMPLPLTERRNFVARFQGEGRFVLAAPEEPRLAWEKGTTPPPSPGPAGGALIAALVHGLRSGLADRDADRRVSVDELFAHVEASVAAAEPGRAAARWAFDQSKADLVIADAALPGEDHHPTPIPNRYAVAQDIRPPILDLIVPTYVLDRNFFLLDWNPAFDELVAGPLKLVRGLDHAKAFVQALANVEDVVRHAKDAFGGERHPLVDTEPLVYRSEAYGTIRFQKVAAQITDEQGLTKGWSVCLNLLEAESDPWPAMLARIEDEVNWSRYAVVYDTLLLHFPEYRRLIEQVTGLASGRRRVIDLGAGTGNNALKLLEDPAREVWAVELNETMLRHFRAKLADAPADFADRLTIVKDNILRLDALPRSTFDAAIMTNVLYAVRDREACLREVNRILKPGGVLALSTPHRETDVEALFDRMEVALDRQGLLDRFGEHVEVARARHEAMSDMIHRDTVDETLAMIRESGFEVEGEPARSYVDAVIVLRATKRREPSTAAAAPGAASAPPTPSRRPTVGRVQGGVRDVFVSFSADDAGVAGAIFRYLEDQAISCWIASRDIPTSEDFGAAIVRAIKRSRLMVLVLSRSANASSHTPREVALAAKEGLPIIPFRVADIDPSEALAYYLSNVHWFDAFPPPAADHVPRLAGTIKALLSSLAGTAAEADQDEADDDISGVFGV